VTEEIQPAPKLQNWKLTLAYDGTEFRGWQVQPGELTVQGELQAALGRITGESPLPQGSGRTDAGVHALGQVASFTLSAPIPAENLQRALNRTLPPAIRERRQAHFMHGTRRSPRATSTGFFARRSAPRFWLATSTPALGRWTWRRCKALRGSLRVSTIL
jgi:hypothetical protein